MASLVYLTVKEYAQYRRVSVRTVQRWLEHHVIPAERTCGSKGNWRIRVWREMSHDNAVNEAVFSAEGQAMHG